MHLPSDANSPESAPIHLSNKPGAIPPAGTVASQPLSPRVVFQAPNAKAGQVYCGKLREVGGDGRALQFKEIVLPAALALTLSEQGELLGQPNVAGDHLITFQWSADGVHWRAGQCVLLVNPDPRSLWQINEPASDAIYPKPHSATQAINEGDLKIAAASRRGRSHEHAGLFRDDDFFVQHDAASGWSVLLVADGAGSARYSRYGSKLAVETAGEYLLTVLKADLGASINHALQAWDADPESISGQIGGQFHSVFYDAATLAVDAIEQAAISQQSDAKDYASTLLAAAVKREGGQLFLATFWIGDGAIAAYGPRGKVRLMGLPDSGEFAGQTRFLDRAALASDRFAQRIKIGRYTDISAVILMSDGISDPKFETDKGLVSADKWNALWDEIAPSLVAEHPEQSLLDWMGFFIPGHHDDRSMTLLWA
ncbi:PP2C family serine/threonine-protein phosphatase [Iodobacter ciconiae]|uniref:Protein phosphatase 2C domain-containing protein n=1 Tax=Iodobacter ciconiae TaxID=2496266 RepID=A0A3S8ZTX0_9NEIS|nr:PP2C family serine/threonine-protein phosphatase [Iodobacter ciconiae]AZN36957.1 protein phosphatase 2C domain-containing protein [Iodobacter ciconiae]